MGVKVLAVCDQCGTEQELDNETGLAVGWIKVEQVTDPRYETIGGGGRQTSGLFCSPPCVVAAMRGLTE